MVALRPRNGSTHVVVSDLPTKKPTVARLNSQASAKKANFRAKLLDSSKSSRRRGSSSSNTVTVSKSTPEELTPGQSSNFLTFSGRPPRTLPRPPYREVSAEALCAVGFESMVNEDRNIVRMMVESIIPQFNYIAALYDHICERENNTGGRETVVLDYSQSKSLPACTVLPTHMLAISTKPHPSSNAPKKVVLYPVHSSVLAMHCASLAPFPPVPPIDQASLDGTKQVRLPVMELNVPSPESFPMLMIYLYSKIISGVVNTCLPSPPPRDGSMDIASFCRQLAQTHSIELLSNHLGFVYGLWKNCTALGIFDMRLWAAMDFVWAILVDSIEIAHGLKVASDSKPESTSPSSSPSS
ncbi:hypothetical protein CVT24_004093 [Panaeolus cyanescens]|uniref:Clp1-like protein n=1 Tax=Panaeolus cyanescens TaxID=181874 RepID=A0A409Y5V1_9AGAR|nr:hypothetical protein CVT24_004093 [Panaeolus cyanescens]